MDISDDLQFAFAYFFSLYHDPIKAAQLAHLPPGYNPFRLLFSRSLKKNLKKFDSVSQLLSPIPLAQNALKRIIFSSSPVDVVDALENGSAISQEDAFAVAEIKKPKTGGFEIRFFDKLKAIELLTSLSAESSPQSDSILAAIQQGAVALKNYPGGGDCDEL